MPASPSPKQRRAEIEDEFDRLMAELQAKKQALLEKVVRVCAYVKKLELTLAPQDMFCSPRYSSQTSDVKAEPEDSTMDDEGDAADVEATLVRAARNRTRSPADIPFPTD